MSMNSDPIRYGIVGLGRAGWDIHIKELRDRSDASIVAIADPDPRRRHEAKTELDCHVHDDLTSLLTQSDVEVVVIATPSHLHESDTIAALATAKHVVVEKPMAMSLEEADRMIEAADQAQRRLFVHQNYRFLPIYAHLREMIDSGILGEIYHIRNTIYQFDRRNDWQTLASYGGGLLNNTCPHYLDILLQLLDAPVVDVYGDLRQVVSSGDVEDHVKAMLRAANGRTADMEISSAQRIEPAPPQWTLCGTCGTLTSDGKISTIHYFDPSKVELLPVVDQAVEGRTYDNMDRLPWQEKTLEIPRATSDNFHDNVWGVLRENKQMFVTPQSVREVLRVMLEIRKGTEGQGRSQERLPMLDRLLNRHTEEHRSAVKPEFEAL